MNPAVQNGSGELSGSRTIAASLVLIIELISNAALRENTRVLNRYRSANTGSLVRRTAGDNEFGIRAR